MKQVGHVKSNQEGELQVCRSIQLAGQPLPRLGKAGRKAFFRSIHRSGGTIIHITQCSTRDWQAAVLGRNSSSLSIEDQFKKVPCQFFEIYVEKLKSTYFTK